MRDAIRAQYLAAEEPLVRRLASEAALDQPARAAISARAADLVRQVRETGKVGVMESFLAEYGLSTDEGVALMCLAEAMLRVPDSLTVDELIRDKITPHDWASHVGDSGSILVNASTWALLLTGKVLDDDGAGVAGTLHALVRRLGEPVIRRAVAQAMAEMGAQFVLGRTIEEAMARGDSMVTRGYTYSYDMLGEAARTEADALRYHAAYTEAIRSIAGRADKGDVRQNPGISVKLSALHPRYEQSQRETMLPVLSERLLELAQAAARSGIGFNIDAEEADRLDLSLDVVERVLSDQSLKGWDGFGVVVQAFGRRALPTLDWLHDLAESLDRRIMVRLVKGAYWDMEIKRAQVLGLADYPVFTRKEHTDISYLAGARKLLGMTDRVYPQFATHNAHSAAAILELAEDKAAFEFQRLHGMGEALHDAVMTAEKTRCRIYAPVGAHQDLLAYLVRRLLENGANSSFVNQVVDLSVAAEEIARDPIEMAEENGFAPHPAIPQPANIFAPRRNSKGWDVTDPAALAEIEAGRVAFATPYQWNAGPITSAGGAGEPRDVINPANPSDTVGDVVEADAALVEAAVGIAVEAQPDWAVRDSAERAAILRRAADLYEENACEIFALVAREAGKTLLDGVAEVREAVDFLRYYADGAEMAGDAATPRGVIVCISPWNFPLAIFTGQIAAALAAGNAVVAKPAEQTPLIAFRAVQWLLEAGVPEGVLQLLPGDGAQVGAPLTADPRLGGVCFTGSTEVAKIIDRQLSNSAPDAMLIAETGGLNAMIVDSTALLEQATRDIVRAAFQSAGQRCSALRVLYVQKDVEEKLLEMLSGAMDALVAGDPWANSTDVAPVIDAEAAGMIRDYLATMAEAGCIVKQVTVPETGLFVPPSVIRVSGIGEVEREIFGPVLHVASFDGDEIEDIVTDINARGYGLTFGLHTRIDNRVQRVLDALHVGNVYVNRDQIGAIVGSQPFGGHGLSGTGPKAGGPLYLERFARSPQPSRHAAEGRIVEKEEALGALSGLSGEGWAVAPDRVARLRAALRGKAAEAMSAAAALDFGPIDLPGPTGESNQYELRPRGVALSLGPDGATARDQAVQALAAGNAVLVIVPDAAAALGDLRRSGLPLAVLEGRLDPDALPDLQIDLVAYAGSDATLLRRALAARDGPIVPLVTETIEPAAYCLERAICIDTTAAGGNASLLAETGA
ncbi:MAG: bifunctional proline dehydrogenase/L-glutamate gamma-semialdehyde dehydrogenase PutA [Paracoccaceae bacterium]|nr:bifunctional proline dehydrogenase/L-glutamate gamma-semialdehyde dehydrogenase PutA [Paracoccaceae bacterium]